MNVLIVDDQPEVVESMVTGVNWKKIPVEQVFTAYSVKEAQSVFERERIDVLLCDIEMPPTNGFALLRWAQERFPAWCAFSFLRTRNLNMRRRP